MNSTDRPAAGPATVAPFDPAADLLVVARAVVAVAAVLTTVLSVVGIA
jgi:hypothetical protein